MSANDANNSGSTAKKSHAERVRGRMETEDLNAILGRFFNAVSWRNNNE